MSRAVRGWVSAAALGLALAACRTVPTLPESTLSALNASPRGYLAGAVEGVSELAILNQSDFVYSTAFGPSSQHVAGLILGARQYSLQIFAIPPTAEPDDFVRQDGRIVPQVSVDVNPYEFDVESLDFAPDGSRLVTAGRDGAVRLFDVKTGALLAAMLLEEPLSVVAFHPSGRYLVAGSASGTLTVLETEGLRFSNEFRAHPAEIRGLVFSSDGQLYSGGWDRTIARYEVREAAVDTASARVQFERKAGHPLVRGSLDEAVLLTFAFDSREKHVFVRSEAARVAGIDVGRIEETVQVPTSMGEVSGRIARGRTVSFKGLKVSNVDVVICDACVPAEAQGVLGEPFLSRVKVVFDEETKLAALSLLEPSGAGERMGLVLTEGARHPFPAFVNDLTIDASGARLGVAFSDVPAQRNREVYLREKKGVLEPLADANAGAIVDAKQGRVIRSWPLHHGVVSTAAISPDGASLATGGWDKRLQVFSLGETRAAAVAEKAFGWSVRRVRFSPEGRFLSVAAWTPQNPVGTYSSDPSLVLYTVRYGEDVTVKTPAQ